MTINVPRDKTERYRSDNYITRIHDKIRVFPRRGDGRRNGKPNHLLVLITAAKRIRVRRNVLVYYDRKPCKIKMVYTFSTIEDFFCRSARRRFTQIIISYYDE